MAAHILNTAVLHCCISCCQALVHLPVHAFSLWSNFVQISWNKFVAKEPSSCNAVTGGLLGFQSNKALFLTFQLIWGTDEDQECKTNSYLSRCWPTKSPCNTFACYFSAAHFRGNYPQLPARKEQKLPISFVLGHNADPVGLKASIAYI